MHYTSETVRKLTSIYKDISRLNKIGAVLDWDMNVHLPTKGIRARSDQSALLSGIVSDRWHGSKFRALLEKASGENKLLKHEKAIVRNLVHVSNYYYKVPKKLIIEFSKATSEAFMAWQQAKEHDDFEVFRPHLEKVIELNKMIADKLGFKENPYDALLDLYEPNLTARKCKEIFGLLVTEIRPLLSKIQKSKKYNPTPQYVGESYYYSPKKQEEISMFVLRKIGYDLKAGRLDVSSHPFTTDFDRQDVRITTRYTLNDFRESITSTIHEAGHAMYEQGISEDYDNTPLSGGVSLGIHESQSRFWENQIGRSRAFISFLTPILQAFYPKQLADVRSKDMFRVFNHVTPSLIRVEADEVTYNLHIALRFEIEEAVINGRVKVKELPELWNETMKKYIGIVPDTNANGVLQDVHWSYGSFGYFPTYTLGNLYSAQFTNKMKDEIDIEKSIRAQEFGTILSWLRTNIHQYGSLYWPDELVKKVTGEKLNPKHLVKYLQDKYKKIYDLE